MRRRLPRTWWRVRVARIEALRATTARPDNSFGSRVSEFQAMVKMLTSTVGAISAAGDSNVQQLQVIEKQVESVTKIEDVRHVKDRLAECLDGIRRETERQRSETARTAEDLMQNLEASHARAVAAQSNALDPVTGLLPRRQAEEAIAKACRDEVQAYVLVDRDRSYPDPQQSIRSRSGR